MRKALFLALATAVVLGLAMPASAITNGRPDGNAHPYVGLAVFDVDDGEGGHVPSHRCSASLLSPTLVLTAGHCTDGTVAARIWFDEIVEGNPEYPFSGPSSYDGTPHTYPGFCIGCGQGLPGFAIGDVGLIALTEPVPVEKVSVYAQLPAAGVVDTLKNKTPIDLVGYGVQEQDHGGGPPRWTGPRVRLFAPTELVSGKFVHSENFMRLALNPGGGSGGTCFGDSGGPDLPAGSTTVLAVNSYVTNSNCGGVGYSQRVDIPEVLSWIGGF
jgi:hypothetical protein